MTDPSIDDSLVDLPEFKRWPGVIVEEPEQTDSAEYVLAAASDYVRAQSGNPDRWPDASLTPRAVKAIVVQVAARVWTNPSGAVLNVTGPFSEQFKQTIAEGMHLSADERNTLDRIVAQISGRTSSLWTVPTTRDGDGCGDYTLVPVEGCADPFAIPSEDVW